jgi:DNA helicase-2/ATP-dependent DNA helicase PcrA
MCSLSTKKVFTLNPAQEAAVRAPAGPLLIVAGAGTGKTRTLTSRLVHFMEQGMRPERICAITFTNKAAKEMADRMARMTSTQSSPRGEGEVRHPFVGTFHSLGARILRKECHAFCRDFNFTIFDDHDSFDVVKKILKPAGGEAKEEPKKKETPGILIEAISRAKNLNLQGEAPHPILSRYEAVLQENNAFDFDDLIEKVVALFRSSPRVLAKYQDMFDAVLVDEYQDINPKQHEFVQLLAGKHRNLSAVGDDEQTIYGWRYADIKIFLGFERDWPGAQVHFLEENYRSTGAIIRGAASVAKNNRVRAPKNLYTNNPDGEPITLYEAWSESEEAEWVGEKIKNNRAVVKNIAILYRTNAQSRAVEQALIRRDVPYRIFGGLKFYERREIKDAVAALRYAGNSRDAVARERLTKNLTKRRFAAFQARLDGFTDKKPAEILDLFLETYKYMEYLADNFTNVEERQENIAELSEFVSGFDSMSALLEKLSLLQSTDDANSNGKRDADGEAVNLMTIHMAKGLEFDNVFLIGAAEGLLPHARSMDREPQLEEERRLMYVAMTRARDKLHISFSGAPSRFIGEIPEDCLRLASADSGDADNESGGEEVVYF